MNSDLDDLLNEVNGCFDGKSGASKSSNKPSQSDSYSYNAGQQRTGFPSSIQTSNPVKDAQHKFNKGFDEILNSPDPFATQNQRQVIKSPDSSKFKDDLLDDLINETSKLSTNYKETQPRSSFSSRPTQEKTSGLYSAPYGGTSNPSTQSSKCFNPYLGPSNKSQGAFAKPCEKLRCITCDFIVQRFDGARWDSTSDYYWFRNYIGNVAELKKKLEKDNSCAAYACQCSWKNITELDEVAKYKDIKWVCAGH